MRPKTGSKSGSAVQSMNRACRAGVRRQAIPEAVEGEGEQSRYVLLHTDTGNAVLQDLLDEPGQQWALQRAIRQHVKDVYDAAGIEIPFPQRDLHLRSVDPAALTGLGAARPSGS